MVDERIVKLKYLETHVRVNWRASQDHVCVSEGEGEGEGSGGRCGGGDGDDDGGGGDGAEDAATAAAAADNGGGGIFWGLTSNPDCSQFSCRWRGDGDDDGDGDGDGDDDDDDDGDGDCDDDDDDDDDRFFRGLSTTPNLMTKHVSVERGNVDDHNYGDDGVFWKFYSPASPIHHHARFRSRGVDDDDDDDDDEYDDDERLSQFATLRL